MRLNMTEEFRRSVKILITSKKGHPRRTIYSTINCIQIVINDKKKTGRPIENFLGLFGEKKFTREAGSLILSSI